VGEGFEEEERMGTGSASFSFGEKYKKIKK